MLINASPDLRAQIDASPSLQPRPGEGRSSPIVGVILTNADLDHVLGLYLLREGAGTRICATESVRHCLSADLGIQHALEAFAPVEWSTPSLSSEPLPHPFGPISISLRAIPLPAQPPRYSQHRPPSQTPAQPGHSIALEIQAASGTLLIAPDVGEITPALATAIARADVILFDGTFWSDDELQHLRPGARTAREMGHLPVSESLHVLREAPARAKTYIHINNTSPILVPDSPERHQVEEAGLSVGRDFTEFTL